MHLTTLRSIALMVTAAGIAAATGYDEFPFAGDLAYPVAIRDVHIDVHIKVLT